MTDATAPRTVPGVEELEELIDGLCFAWGMHGDKDGGYQYTGPRRAALDAAIRTLAADNDRLRAMAETAERRAEAADRVRPADREVVGLEPPGCPLPGMCSCPGGEAKLAERLGAAQADRDALLRALGYRTGPLDWGGHRESILRQAGRLPVLDREHREARAALAQSWRETEWQRNRAEAAEAELARLRAALAPASAEAGQDGGEE